MPRFENVFMTLIACLLYALGVSALASGGVMGCAFVSAGTLTLALEGALKMADRRKHTQTLTVRIPVRRDTPEKVLPLFLSSTDRLIFIYLRKHGRAESDGDETVIHYRGRQIYFPSNNFFLLKHCGGTPYEISIVECGEYDLLG